MSRLSEEAIVVLAVLAVFAYAQYLEGMQVETFVILFVALVGYLSVRVLNLARRTRKRSVARRAE